MNTAKPAPTEYPEYFEPYIKKVQQSDLMDALKQNKGDVTALIHAIPVAMADYRYAEGKWTIKEVLLHICDAERIFAYRALRFARNDKTELSSFNEDQYVPNSGAASRSLFSLHDEFMTVRDASISLFNSFDTVMLGRKGFANKREVSVRALGYIIAGHAQHHIGVLKERYLPQ